MVNSGVKGKAYNGLEGKSDWSKMLKEDILEIKMETFSEIKNIQEKFDSVLLLLSCNDIEGLRTTRPLQQISPRQKTYLQKRVFL